MNIEHLRVQGCTPLHLAADNNKDEAAKRLVHYGADLNKLDMVISPPARVASWPALCALLVRGCTAHTKTFIITEPPLPRKFPTGYADAYYGLGKPTRVRQARWARGVVEEEGAWAQQLGKNKHTLSFKVLCHLLARACLQEAVRTWRQRSQTRPRRIRESRRHVFLRLRLFGPHCSDTGVYVCVRRRRMSTGVSGMDFPR